MITVEEVSLQYGDRVLFDDVNLSLSNKYRYIVVGANGTGKSTFLTLLAGEMTPTIGSITRAKACQIGWMKQVLHLYDEMPIVNVVILGREELWEALQAKEQLLQRPHWTDEDSNRLAKFEERINRLGGYRAEADAEALLIGLGISSEKHREPLKQFSGGWKMRVLLAQLLFNNPDILLLDEPTNYLDIDTIAWFEKYLIDTYQGMIIAVSHDQRFLENIGTCVLDIDYGQILAYPGTYSQFLNKKAEIVEQKEKEHARLEEKVAKMERFIERFGAKATKASQANARKKMIEKIVWPDIGISSRRSPQFGFVQKTRSGQIPIKAKQLCKIFDPDILIGPLDLEIHRGERIAFIGKNGGGKTTMIKMLTSQLLPDEGSVALGHQVDISIFHQEHKHLFTGDETILAWLEKETVGLTEEKRRQILGRLLFRPEDTNKKIFMLSGGEMARLLLAKIMLAGANILVLDEPTNHLDLEAKEALASALIAFPGTVIFVSHDRYFIQKVATKVLEVNRDVIKEVK
ncbi:MAG: ABC-F family ATP-binding cassette domain-containing protein [Verrucomicrobia bacterium]|nr:ABC-F family ATP-binding cassette domain-containing protein [Verrucomicrobiota bacterium]